MPQSQNVTQKWEARLPSLDGPWTHWQLDGEGFVIGIFSYQELGSVFRVLKENHNRFSSIFAQRVRLDESGCTILQNQRTEITNQASDGVLGT